MHVQITKELNKWKEEILEMALAYMVHGGEYCKKKKKNC